MKYQLFFDGIGLALSRAEEEAGSLLSIRVTGGTELIRIGVKGEEGAEHFYTLTDELAVLPTARLEQGRNKMTVYGKNKLWKCEDFFYDGTSVRPLGCDPTEAYCQTKQLYEQLSLRLSHAETRLDALEAQCDPELFII